MRGDAQRRLALRPAPRSRSRWSQPHPLSIRDEGACEHAHAAPVRLPRIRPHRSPPGVAWAPVHQAAAGPVIGLTASKDVEPVAPPPGAGEEQVGWGSGEARRWSCSQNTVQVGSGRYAAARRGVGVRAAGPTCKGRWRESCVAGHGRRRRSRRFAVPTWCGACRHHTYPAASVPSLGALCAQSRRPYCTSNARQAMYNRGSREGNT